MKTMLLAIPQELRDRLKIHAITEKTTMQKILLKIISEYLDQRGSPPDAN